MTASTTKLVLQQAYYLKNTWRRNCIGHEASATFNFFLQPSESEGKYTAEEMFRLLAKMNSSVTCSAKLQNLAALLQTNPGFFSGFTLVISVNLSRSFDLSLFEALWALQVPSPQVPLLRVRSAGMLAEMQISFKELGKIETHPDSIVDLRITQPFPGLLDLAQQFDLNVIGSAQKTRNEVWGALCTQNVKSTGSQVSS
ncbi:uncharacterized protein UBRO_20850 [Ustilago bromivora]|uniref:Uncharacterized protein n=1 Tax=Ustilago bromivora TaxID=307758 RepID=A0A1K0HIW6_9BASI|nr:uncharacterized protein UBRO_20850 [Ustilago bromivora]